MQYVTNVNVKNIDAAVIWQKNSSSTDQWKNTTEKDLSIVILLQSW